MGAIFEVWDVQTGNLVGAYDTEPEALATVYRTLERFGNQAADHFALAREDENGRTVKLAQGPDLAARARGYGSRSRRGHVARHGKLGRGHVLRLLHTWFEILKDLGQTGVSRRR